MIAERLEAFSGEQLFQENLETLLLAPLTKEHLTERTALGELVVLRDGSLALRAHGQLLGSPLTDRELLQALQKADDQAVLVVFGVGAGQTARALRRLSKAPIIIYEPDVALLRTLLQWGPHDLGGVFLVDNAADLALVWSQLGGKRKRAVLIKTPGYAELFAHELADVSETVRRLIERVSITTNTLRKRAQIWISDILQNLELLTSSPPFMALEGCYTNVPAFIVGAGPSLDKNVKLLDAARQKGIVFAVNSSVPALAKHGVTPHAVVCLESIDVSHKLRDVPFMNECARIISISASPHTLRANSGPLMLFHESIPQYNQPLEQLTGAAGVSVCGSVCTAAFSMALRLGCSPIVLVGQDMAYTEGRTYAGGTGYESSTAQADREKGCVQFRWNDDARATYGTKHGERHTQEPLLEVPAWGGQGTVFTGSSLMAINTWHSGVAEIAHLNRDTRFVNASEGGAQVAHFEEKTLAQVLSELPDVTVSAQQLFAAAEQRRRPLSREQLSQWARLQARSLGETENKARRVRELGRKAQAAIRRDEPRKVSRAFAALERAEHELKHAVHQAPFVDAWSHCRVEDVLHNKHKNTSLDGRASAEEALLLGGNVAAAVEAAAQELQQTFNELANELGELHQQRKGIRHADDASDQHTVT